MRSISATIAKLVVLGFFFVFSSASLTLPSYAGGGGYFDWIKKYEPPGWDSCYKHGHSWKCKKTNSDAGHPPSSTGLFVSICNGEVGWWNPVTFQDGSTLCIAASIADFYHNDGQLPSSSCTKAKIRHGKTKWEETTSGACPTHSHMYD